MSKPNSTVCILGMHRSGTSLLSKILNLLGVYLGPEAHLLGANSSNKKGYWEHQQFISINDDILRRLGGNWYALPTFTPGWEDAAELDELKRLARATILEDFAGADVWGWKDPRTCLTLPFWQQIAGDMKYVVCLRNPVDVASSLKRRDGFSNEQGVYLWLVYLQRALEYTAGEPRIFVFYEGLLHDWQRELERLSRFVGMPERAEMEDVRTAVRESIDKKLQHHSTPIDYDAAEDEHHPESGLDLAQSIYVRLKWGRVEAVAGLLRTAVEALEPEVDRQKDDPRYEWHYKIQLTARELADLIPAEAPFIWIDWYQWGSDQLAAGRNAVPMLSGEDGKYLGRPLDDEAAISGLERQRQAGVRFIVFGRPAFWWFDCYAGFHSYLRSRFPCALENSRLVVFDLQPS